MAGQNEGKASGSRILLKQDAPVVFETEFQTLGIMHFSALKLVVGAMKWTAMII